MIRVEGRNLLDEGFSGSNARDMNTGRMSKEAATFLTDTIKKAIAPIENTVKTNKVVIAQTASNMAKVIGENTKEFQTIIQDSSEDTQQELLKLLTMMNDAQKKSGDASIVAMNEVVKQIEKLKQSDTSGKLTSALDLDKRQKEIAKPLGRQTVFGAAFKKFTNVDLRRESALQALSPTKLFGLDPGSGDVIKRAQTDAATSGATGALGQLGAALLPSNDTPSKKTATITAPVKNAEGGQVFTTGIDRESLENKQVELLEQILAQLKDMEGIGSGKGFLDTLTAALTGAVASAILPLTVIVGGISGIVWSIKKLAEVNYVENTATPILESREDMYLAGIGQSREQVRKRDARANSPLQRAKDTGLYDEDFLGNSEVDLNVLSSTTDSSMLKSILNDNDISDEDRMRVERRLSQIEREKIDTSTIIGTGVLSSSTQETIKSTSKNKSYMMERMFPVSIGRIGALENKEADLSNLLTPQTIPTGEAVLKTTETAGGFSSEQGTTVMNNIDNSTTINQGSSGSTVAVERAGARNPRTNLPEYLLR